MERVMVFIDGSNLYYGLRNNYNTQKRLNFQQFCTLLCGPSDRLIQIYYYNVPVKQGDNPNAYAAQQKFFANLGKVPFLSLNLGRLVHRTRNEVCPSCSHSYSVDYRTEKGVDVKLATDLLSFAFDNQYDTAILVSNDGDFVPAVQEVMRLKKQVINAEFPQRLPSHLSKSCSRTLVLDNPLLDQCTF